VERAQRTFLTWRSHSNLKITSWDFHSASKWASPSLVSKFVIPKQNQWKRHHIPKQTSILRKGVDKRPKTCNSNQNPNQNYVNGENDEQGSELTESRNTIMESG
jgi:hypothetical protein